jgi:PAS domain S-box-containing protein
MNYTHVFFSRLLQVKNSNQPWQGGDRWSSLNGWLYMVSYFLICVACFIIPVVIGRYLFRRQVNPYYRRIYLLFGAFILTTGITFFLDAISVWIPIYTIKAIVSLVTGVVSVITLFYLFKFLPRAFSLRVSKKRENYKNEERFRLLVEEVEDYAIIMVDLEGHVGTWNKGAEAIKGYTAGEIIGKPISVFYSEEDIAKNEPENNLKTAREQGRFGNETRRIRKDGSVFWANCVITALHDERGELYGYSTVTRDVTERKRLQDGINLLNQDLERRIEEKTREVITGAKRFRALVEHSHDAISLFNEKMEVIYRSPVAQRVRGEVSENLSVMESIHPDDREAVMKMFQDAIENPGKPIPMFFRTIDVNGGFLYADGSLINLLQDESVKAFVTNLRDVTDKQRVQEQLKETLAETRRLAESLQMVREEERTSMAREIHDHLGQMLTVLRLEISMIKSKLTPKDEPIKEKIENAINTTNEVIGTVRKIASKLRPALLDDMGLAAALEWQCREFRKSTGVPCAFTEENFDDIASQVDKSVATAIFRLYQEALTNIMKYAEATQVQSSLIYKDGFITLKIGDNGKGFDMEEIKNKKTLGIVGMKERVLIMDGDFELKSKPGFGTTITVKVKL